MSGRRRDRRGKKGRGGRRGDREGIYGKGEGVGRWKLRERWLG